MWMPFGKHKGVELEDIDENYLRWLVEECNITPNLRRAVEQQLEMFGEMSHADISPAIISDWYRQLAREFHPDHEGGDVVAMKAINRAHDLLLELTAPAEVWQC